MTPTDQHDTPAAEIAHIHGHRVGDDDAWIESQARLNAALNERDTLQQTVAELGRHNAQLTAALMAAEQRSKEAAAAVDEYSRHCAESAEEIERLKTELEQGRSVVDAAQAVCQARDAYQEVLDAVLAALAHPPQVRMAELENGDPT